jgi:hypothetical protein
MLFARLLESQRAAVATEAMLEGAGVSALAHAVLIGSWLFLNRDIERVRPEPNALFTPVQWLVPKDQIPGRPQRETVTWINLAPGRVKVFSRTPDSHSATSGAWRSFFPREKPLRPMPRQKPRRRSLR